MSSSVTLKSEGQKYTGKIILTNYGRTRMLERIVYAENFTDFNFTSIGIGNKISNTYTPDITQMGNEVMSFEISNENVTYSDYVTTIKTNLDIEGEVRMQEIGLFETINGIKKLFAYASGFSMIKSKKISYDLIIDLSLAFTFENESPSKYNVLLKDCNYALMPRIDKLHKSLFQSQLDLERSIEINARLLGYNQAQAYWLEHNKNVNVLNDLLLIGRYNKSIKVIGLGNMTDCFYYPENLQTVTLRNKYVDSLGRLYTLNDDGDEFTDEYGIKYDYIEQDSIIGVIKNGMFVPLTLIKYTQTPVSYVIKNLKDDSKNKYIDLNHKEYTYTSNAQGEFFTDSEGHVYNRATVEDVLEDDKVVIVEGYYQGLEFIRLEPLEPSQMEITGDLQICNRDNINLSGESTIVYTATLSKLTKESIIIGKINPNEDQYYFDLRVVHSDDRKDVGLPDWGLQFTIYSYDKENELNVDSPLFDERKLVGHYRVTYYLSDEAKASIVDQETMFTFVYNGKTDDEADIQMYINTHNVSSSPNYIIDNFNYLGPCDYYRETCTLRNYSQTSNIIDYNKPMYYLIPETESSSFLAFNKELSESEISYLALISQS